MHSTNYFDTLILVSPDSSALAGKVPSRVGTIAALQLDMILGAPYTLTSDDVIFAVYAQKNEIAEVGRAEARQAFFSKGQACFRASPLVKANGWGVHHDAMGRVALYGVETVQYQDLLERDNVTKVSGMRSKRV